MTLDPIALASLERAVPGRVGLEGSPRYEDGRRVFSRPARRRLPAAVVRPSDREQVAAVLRWARTTGTRVSVRSGGHSFDGFPVRDGGVLVDLRDLNDVVLDDSGRLHAMPGATIAKISRTLDGSGRALPTGDCPTVGLGGLVTGGGFGYATRHFGLTLDFLLEATVVTAQGDTLTASETVNPDLFWAVRGGAGCTGVVTDVVLNTVALEDVTGMTLGWDWGAADEAILIFADLMRSAPTELDLKIKIRTTGTDRFMDETSPGPDDAIPGRPLVHIDGQFLGHRDDATALLRPLLDHPAARAPQIREETYLEAMLQLVPLDILSNPAPETLRPCRVASDFSRGPLGQPEADAIVRFVHELQTAPAFEGGAILIEPSNGAVGARQAGDCAFPHRRSDLLYEWELFGDPETNVRLAERHDALLAETRDSLADVLSGGRYVNYADSLDGAADWWGDNASRLAVIARRCDPDGLLISRLRP